MSASTVNPIEILGFIAATCTTLSFVPQVVQVWKTRSVADISYGMYVVMITGNALWLVYGCYSRTIPLVAANIVTILLSGTVLTLKLRIEGARRRRPALSLSLSCLLPGRRR